MSDWLLPFCVRGESGLPYGIRLLGCRLATRSVNTDGYGTHHSVSEAHLPRYLTEWDFKWNTRKVKDGERAAIALKGIEGKRLTYRIPNNAADAEAAG